MKASPQTIRFAVTALASLSLMSAARSEEVLKLIPGFAKSVVVPNAASGNFTAIIGDPKVADFTYGPRNTFWFIGLKEGTTNVLVLNKDTGAEMYNARIEIGGEGRMQVHNKAQLTSYTVYRCNPGCLFVDEVTAKEPAPLPRGHLESSSTYRSNTTLSPPPPAQGQ